jgi:hypothetical protein
MTTRRRLAFALGLPVALAALISLTNCESDGVTPVCPADGSDCVTPPGTSTASVVITTGTGGSSGTGGSVLDAATGQ